METGKYLFNVNDKWKDRWAIIDFDSRFMSSWATSPQELSPSKLPYPISDPLTVEELIKHYNTHEPNSEVVHYPLFTDEPLDIQLPELFI